MASPAKSHVIDEVAGNQLGRPPGGDCAIGRGARKRIDPRFKGDPLARTQLDRADLQRGKQLLGCCNRRRGLNGSANDHLVALDEDRPERAVRAAQQTTHRSTRPPAGAQPRGVNSPAAPSNEKCSPMKSAEKRPGNVEIGRRCEGYMMLPKSLPQTNNKASAKRQLSGRPGRAPRPCGASGPSARRRRRNRP